MKLRSVSIQDSVQIPSLLPLSNQCSHGMLVYGFAIRGTCCSIDYTSHCHDLRCVALEVIKAKHKNKLVSRNRLRNRR